MSVKKSEVATKRSKLSFFDDTTTSVLRMSAKAMRKEEKHRINESINSLEETRLTIDAWMCDEEDMYNSSHDG